MSAVASVKTGYGKIQIMKGRPEIANVDQTVAALAKKAIPLPIPLNSVELATAKKQICQLAQSDEDRTILEKVTAATLHITFPTLISELQKCIALFNEQIGNEPYVAIAMNKRSNEWIAQLAIKYGIKPPSHIYYFQESKSNPAPSHKTVVLFDDCAFSGSTSEELIRWLIDPEEGKSVVRKIYLVIPFTSNAAKKMVLDYAEIAEIVLVTGNLSIPTAQEHLDEGQFKRFCQLFTPVKVSQPEKLMENSSHLAITDWRIADSTSVPANFIKGEIHYEPAVKIEKPLADCYRFRPYRDYQEE